MVTELDANGDVPLGEEELWAKQNAQLDGTKLINNAIGIIRSEVENERQEPKCHLCGHTISVLVVAGNEGHLICPIHGTRGTIHLRMPRCVNGCEYDPVVTYEYDGPE